MNLEGLTWEDVEFSASYPIPNWSAEMARELTTEQQATITNALPPSGKVELLVDTSITAAEEFAGRVAAMFAAHGWEVATTALERPWGSSPSGLVFLSQEDLPMSEAQSALLNALNAADVPFNRMDAMLPEGVDIRLMMGRVGA